MLLEPTALSDRRDLRDQSAQQERQELPGQPDLKDHLVQLELLVWRDRSDQPDRRDQVVQPDQQELMALLDHRDLPD